MTGPAARTARRVGGTGFDFADFCWVCPTPVRSLTHEWSGQVLPRLLGGRLRSPTTGGSRGNFTLNWRSALGFPGAGDRTVQPAGEFGSGAGVDHSDAGLRHGPSAGRPERALWPVRPDCRIRWCDPTITSFSRASALPGGRSPSTRPWCARAMGCTTTPRCFSRWPTRCRNRRRCRIASRNPTRWRTASAFARGRVQLPAASSTAQTFALDPNFRIGYIHYWQLSVQQNLRGLVRGYPDLQRQQGHSPGAGVSALDAFRPAIR